jgi:large conductance mechanosensitive channel
MGFLKDFKEFAFKGNVIDLAVAVIIGAAFGKIITSLVNDIIMPPIGLLLGNVNFIDLFWAMNGVQYESLKVAREAGAPVFAYGSFIQAIIDFLIIAFCIFLLVKAVQKAQKKKVEASAPPAEPPAQEKLLTEIRDLLKNK